MQCHKKVYRMFQHTDGDNPPTHPPTQRPADILARACLDADRMTVSLRVCKSD